MYSLNARRTDICGSPVTGPTMTITVIIGCQVFGWPHRILGYTGPLLTGVTMTVPTHLMQVTGVRM